MATVRESQKLADPKKENCEEHHKRNLAEDTNDGRSQKDFMAQVFEKIEASTLSFTKLLDSLLLISMKLSVKPLTVFLKKKHFTVCFLQLFI